MRGEEREEDRRPDGEATEEVAHEPYASEGDTGEYEAWAVDGDTGEYDFRPMEPGDREPYEDAGETGEYELYRGDSDPGDAPAHEAARETGEHDALPAGSGPLAPGLAVCPTCGRPVERRQLVCLNCGGRVALGGGRSVSTEPIVPLIVAVVVLGAALFGFAVSEITSGDGSETAQTTPAAPTVVEGEGQPTATEPEDTATTGAQPSETSGRRVARRNPLAWPRGLTAHTVVLVTTGDRAGALRTAREARASGLEAGMLPSDPYNLGTGLWIVFSGRFSTREGAARQAAQLAERYPGAYPQLVQRSQ